MIMKNAHLDIVRRRSGHFELQSGQCLRGGLGRVLRGDLSLLLENG